MSIGARIRQARKSRGYSQTDLAARLQVSQPTVANWELGAHDPRQLMLAKISEQLGVSRSWLSSGERSPDERDKQAAAAYLRRPVVHVPLIGWTDAVRAADGDTFDPHVLAEDYIPVTAGSPNLFALFIADEAVNLAFPNDTLVVIDYHDRTLIEGRFMLANVGGRALLRRWRDAPQRLEPYSSNPNHEAIYTDAETGILGRATVSIRFH